MTAATVPRVSIAGFPLVGLTWRIARMKSRKKSMVRHDRKSRNVMPGIVRRLEALLIEELIQRVIQRVKLDRQKQCAEESHQRGYQRGARTVAHVLHEVGQV